MASTYLKRTPVGAGDSNRIFTISFWFKRAKLSGAEQYLFECNEAADNNDNFRLIIGSGENLIIQDTEANVSNLDLRTNRVLRDTNSWYHLVLEVDTTQSTSSDRAKLYINGVQETSFSTSTYPSQNYDTNVSQSGEPFIIGRRESTASPGSYFDGSMTHYHFIDGTAYAASTFGETDATTGIWKPKTAPSVTYGTNGFFLKFENSGSMGTDSSGNGNNFTVNGTLTQTVDTPSNVFATYDNSHNLSGTLTNGNTTYATSTSYGSQSNTATSTLGVSSGKYYAEFKHGGTSGTFPNGMVGVYYDPENVQNGVTNPAQSRDAGFGYAENGFIYNNGSTDTGTTYTTGDIIGVALDLDANKVYWYKNGTLVNTGGTTIDAGETYFFFVADTSSGGSTTYQANFGNGVFGTTAVSSAQNPDDGIGIFEYDVPTGYRALCTKSINAEEYA